MKKVFLSGVILLVAMSGMLFSLKAQDQKSIVGLDVDWESFMGKHDMWWTENPEGWKEAPHLGNASIGSMIYMEEDVLRIQLFHNDAQDHRDNSHGWTAYSRPRFGIGNLLLQTEGKITGGEWHMDLWNAELRGSITTTEGTIGFRHYVHADSMLIITEMWPSEKEKSCSWKWEAVKAETSRSGYPSSAEEIPDFAKRYGEHYLEGLVLNEPNPAGILEDAEGILVWDQHLRYGGQHATAWTDVPGEDSQRTLIVSIETTYPEFNASRKAFRNVKVAREADREDLEKTHKSWWHDYYPKSFVSIPEKRLESYYWQTIYRYGCTARQGRSFVYTSGLWFQGGPWPYVTTDWNIQAAHWALPMANRLEQSGEILDALYRARETLSENVRPVEWQEDAAFLHLTVAPDMIGSRDQDMRYWDGVGCLPWTLHNCWWQYRYSMDDDMLREKLYPLLKRSVNLYLHMLEERDGKLHLPPTFNPETGTYEDCNFDLSLLKWGCETLLWTCERLDLIDPLIPTWKDVLERSSEFPVDEAHGFLLGQNEPPDKDHRHASHLLMIYPLYQVNIDQAGTDQVLNASVDWFTNTSEKPAMISAHATALATAIERSDLALDLLRKQADDLWPNGMWFQYPCLEASLTMANGIQTMLLQDWDEIIRFFPAVPEEWEDVSFHELRTQGAFLVSGVRKGGKTRMLRVKSLAGEACRIKTDMKNPGVAAGSPVELIPLENQVYELKLDKGQEVVLTPKGRRIDDMMISEITHN